MSCPTVIRVTTAQGPPGVGLPAGTGDAGKFVRKAGSTAYAYELVTPDAVGLPQDLAVTSSPTFVGLILSGLTANGLLFTGAGGLLTRLPLGGGLAITGGALVATQAPTDLDYVPATRLLTSSTGLDVTLPLFTSTAAGLVGASGGGTTTFLRADGTWASPPGGSGATDLSYDSTTRTVASSTGADAVLTLADGTNPGLLSNSDFLKLASLTFGLVPVAVRNNSGATIQKGVPVYVTGSSGVRVTIAPADASTEATAARTIGLTSAAIANNTDGTVIAVGELTGLDTSTLAEGQIIWLSETTGAMTSTRPTQPAHGVVLGYCIKQGAGTSGIVYVKVDNGLELEELHDVLITGKTTGQALMVGADGLWKNRLLVATDISNSSSGGRTVLTGTPAQGRSALELDTAAQSPATAFISATTTRSANVVLAGPATGPAAAPTFRALAAADLPATAVAAGAYGSATAVGSFTVDAQGRLTAASSVTISIPATGISDSSTSGRTVLTGTPAQGRSALELGSAAQSATTDFATPAALASGLASKADLVGGVVPTSQIPSIALVQYLGSVATQPAMLALRGQGGDWCIRTDTATEWVIVANDGASLADWIQLPTGIAPVTSVNGQTGVVTLGTGNLAESGGNLFFTSARARSALSVSGALSYDPTTGVFSYNPPTPFDPASPGPIGGATAAAGSFTSLTASTRLGLPSGAPPSPAPRDLYPVGDALRYRDSSNTEQVILYGAGNLANLANPATARANIGAAASGAIGASGITMTAGILAAAAAGAPQVYGLVGLALAGSNLATLTDAVIPLGNATTGPAAAVLDTFGRFPYTFIFSSSTTVPIWSCDSASQPTGLAIQLDIRISLSGTFTSIYANLPTINVGANTSQASGGTFSTAFINGTGGFTALTIPQDASVRFVCTQAATGGGGGLKVQLTGRRGS